MNMAQRLVAVGTVSLKRRLLLGVIGAVSLLWLAAAALTWQDAQVELGELLDAHLTQAAALLVAQQAHTGEPDEDGLMDAPPLHRYSQRVAFQVWHQGQLTLRSPNAPDQAMSTLLQGFETRQLDGIGWRLFATRGAEADVQVYVAERLDSRAEILHSLMRGLLGPLLLAMPLIVLAAWLAIAAGLKPLRQLSDVLAARRPGDLRPVALPAGEPAAIPGEIQPVLQALNGLLTRIGGLMEAERRFTADAAHELRTPIAGIRAQAQVAGQAQEPAERQHALQATLEGCDRASHLVGQLLTLSRLESSAALKRQPVDLGALARSVAADLAPSAYRQQQTLALDADAGCIVAGDESLLRVLLRNLLDNALRYSPPGAQVAILVNRQTNGQTDGQAEGVLLQVEDSGPGMAPQDLARLGERFFRPLGQSASGSGLGWSIVQRIAQAHGALLSAQMPSSLGGLCVRVAWPAGEPAALN